MKILRSVAAAFSYFSILPLRSFDRVPGPTAIVALPLVGIFVGSVAGFAAYAVYVRTHSTLAMAIAGWLLSIALSGAIHVDGFLDCCDGLFAMVTRERRLEIMRDPHHGTYAICGMMMISVLWIYALTLIEPRMIVAVMMVTALTARTCGSLPAGPRWGWPMAIVPLALCLTVTGGNWFPAAILAAAIAGTTAAILAFARARLGDVRSGDVFGAVIVVTEVTLLLMIPYVSAAR